MSESIDREFSNRQQWRKWLESNNSTEKEIWVIIHKKKSSQKGLRYQDAVEEAICFGWIDSKMQSIDDERFRLRFSPRRKNSYWSKINKNKAERMIKAGKMTQAGFSKIQEAKRSGKWNTAYSSKTAVATPADLEEALKECNSAWGNFKKLSNSAKFQYIHWVENAKKDETRRKRIAIVVERATQSIKPS